MNILSKTKYLVLCLTIFLVLMPNMLLADYGALALSAIFAYSLAIVGGIMIGIVFAFIFNVIVELLGFSKPKHIILQVIFAVTFSGLYNYLEDEYNLLYDY